MIESQVGALVLAAGRSTRMGANKLVVDLHGRPAIAHVLDALAAAGFPKPILVTGHQPEVLGQALNGRAATLVQSEDYALGLAHSLRAGMAAIPEEWDAVVICLGDMPFVPVPFLRQMREEGGASSIMVPVAGDRQGNPVLWGRDYFSALRALEGDRGAKALLGKFADRISIVPCADDGIFLDIDTDQALAAARARTGGGD